MTSKAQGLHSLWSCTHIAADSGYCTDNRPTPPSPPTPKYTGFPVYNKYDVILCIFCSQECSSSHTVHCTNSARRGVNVKWSQFGRKTPDYLARIQKVALFVLISEGWLPILRVFLLEHIRRDSVYLLWPACCNNALYMLNIHLVPLAKVKSSCSSSGNFLKQIVLK